MASAQKDAMLQALELFDDAPHTEHAVTLFNQDFRHAGQTDDLTIFQAEYALKSPELECLHCLLADQLVGEDDETPWLSAPVMAAYVSLAEREDGVPVRMDDAICIMEHRSRLYLVRMILRQATLEPWIEDADLTITVYRAESRDGVHQGFYDQVANEAHDAMAACLYWHGQMDIEDDAIRENHQIAVEALQTVVRDLIDEFNQQMPEGLVANLEQAGMFEDDFDEELEEGDDEDGEGNGRSPIIH
jgi:hypothetical protein